MNNTGNRRKIQFGIVLVVLILIALLLIWMAQGGRASVDTPDPQPGGETLIAGNGTKPDNDGNEDDQRLPGQSVDHESGDRDPQKQDTVLPDDGAGAEASLEKPQEYHENTPVSLGIDVSKWQGKIDWNKVAASGVDFAIIRIGFRTADTGKICADPYAAYNLQHASEAGIQLGAYFFSTAVNAEEAIEEAAWTVDFLAGYPITYPIAYNCEGFLSPDSRMYGIPMDERTDNALAFLRTIEEYGYESMLHASKHDLTDGISWDTAQIDKNFPVWVAQYPSVPYPQTKAATYSGDHTMWQYTSQGNVPGINTFVDLNVAYFKYDEAAAPRDPDAAGEVADVPIDSTFREVNELVTAKEKTNLRTEPSAVADETIAAVIRNGEWVTRTGISSKGWSRLAYNGQTLYAISSLLLTEEEAEKRTEEKPTEPPVSTIYDPVNDTVTAKVETNLRNAAGTDGTEVVAILKNGEWLTRTGIGSNGWSRIDYHGQTVYALTSYLTTDENYDPDNVDDKNIVWTDASAAMTAKEKTNLRDKPTTEGSEVVATIYHGDRVVCTGIGSNGWSRVVYEGQTLYAVSSLLTEYNE